MSLTSETGGTILPRLFPTPQAGRRYGIGDMMGSFAGKVAMPADVIKDRIFTRAFPWSYDKTLVSLDVETYAAHAPATTKCLLAIYADNNGIPGTKLLTAPELTLAAANTVYTATVSWKAPPGIYWLALTLSDGQPEGARILCENEAAGPAVAQALPLGTVCFHGVATRTYDGTIPSTHPSMTFAATQHVLPFVAFGF